ncbi:MAG: rhodanese-like domain-containing protein [Desulfoprunum sp.]|nr:rhodanese-like domain-containing protein [Desulfoprunum sp.]
MNWLSLFDKAKEITAEQARDYLGSQAPDSLQLIDVRQPKEYEDAHIPGALLIPLNDLPRRIGEIAADRNTIVYCRSGARSSAACQILTEYQFRNVLNLRGGMLQWQGQRAIGDENRGLEYFVSGNFASAFAMALQMEAGLKQFYLLLAGATDVLANKELLQYMAKLEDGHIAKLRARHQHVDASLPESIPPDVVEGGINPRDFTEAFQGHLDSQASILQLAMMFEAQALDLYSRLARRHTELEAQSFFLQMAVEEQKHLDRLASELDKLMG